MPLYHKSNSQINNTNLRRLPINWPSSSLVGKGENRSGKQLVSAWYGHNPLKWQWILDADRLRADTSHCVVPAGMLGSVGHCARTEVRLWMWHASWNTDGQCPSFLLPNFLCFNRQIGQRMRYRSVYVPEGNGIAERCHHTVKRIAVRSRCSVAEAIYWYNVTPKDNETLSCAPVNGIYQYEQCVKGIDPQTISTWSQK